MDAESLTRRDQLLGWALDAGFDRAGLAVLSRSEQVHALDAWLARGEHAGMGYMAEHRALRGEPAGLLDGARSVLVVALHYAPLATAVDETDTTANTAVRQGSASMPVSVDLWSHVARYARGSDYHQIMWDRLGQLGGRIAEAYPGTRFRAVSDSAPLLERELATRAGLGSFGKNTLLIGKRVGSWFLLGELLLTLDVAPSTPTGADVCGRCTRCLDACPTAAFPAPFRLDANRCISYWTIEHRGAIPRELRPQLGEWVFGCDVCQEVCPHNRRPLLADHPELAVPAARVDLAALDVFALDEPGFRQLFRGSPLRRAKLVGLQRNAAVALGNSGDRAVVPRLLQLLEGGLSTPPAALAPLAAIVREHLAWAIGRLGGDLAQDGLRQALVGETDPAVRREIEAALAELKDRQNAPS